MASLAWKQACVAVLGVHGLSNSNTSLCALQAMLPFVMVSLKGGD